MAPTVPTKATYSTLPVDVLKGVPEYVLQGRMHPGVVATLCSLALLILVSAIILIVRCGMHSVAEHDEQARMDRERLAGITAVGGLGRIIELADQGDTRLYNEYVLSKAERDRRGVARTFEAITVVKSDGTRVTVQHPIPKDMKAKRELEKSKKKHTKSDAKGGATQE